MKNRCISQTFYTDLSGPDPFFTGSVSDYPFVQKNNFDNISSFWKIKINYIFDESVVRKFKWYSYVCYSICVVKGVKS